MSGVFTCLAYQHDTSLVALAGLLCFLANFTTVNSIRRARDCATTARLGWVTVAGIAGGFGIWATHFAAMLAYDPGLAITFDLSPTLVSLAIALISTFVASFMVVSLPRPQGSLAGGLVFGVGVTCMHFMGMSAVEFAGAVVWSRPLVLAAIAVPVVTAPFAFELSLRNGARAGLISALVLAFGIVAMHFTAMGAATPVPDPAIAAEAGTLSKPLMMAMIVAVSLSLIGAGLAASAIAQQAKQSSKATEVNFQLLVRGVTDYAIYMLDLNGIVSNWNAGAERAKGYAAAEIIGCNFSRFYSAEDQARGLPQLALKTAREAGRFEAEGKRYRKDGSWFWAHVVIHPILNDEDVLVGYAKITRNITRQKEDNDRFVAIKQNLDLALENMTQGICLFDNEERLILSNARYGEIFGFPEGSVSPGMTYQDIVLKGYQSALDNVEEAERRALQHYSRNIAAIRSGHKIPLHLTASGRTVRTAFNILPQGGWVATFEDISEQVRSEEQIAFMARHDTLTKLPNRAALIDYLGEEVDVAEQASGNVAVIGIDLNKFKQINDQLGHGIGDEVLRSISARLQELVRPHEVVARFGGDEFVAVKRYARLSEVQDFLERLDAAFSSPLEIEAHRLSPGASMGVALYPNDGRSPEALIANADLAMYRAKASLSRHVCFYDVSMDEAARDRAKMAKELWAAIDQNQVRLHYQVQKSIATGRITGYEVLLRWKHPERGSVPPDQFISVAEECGAILPLGEWVLREACREAAHWPMDYKVAVNLSPVQIAHADMPALVESILRETGLAPSRLELEITESSIISDKQRAINALTAIKALGVSIAMDDFGTGYSSLETLRSFPFDKIKLDRSFMIEVEASDEAKAMVRAVLALGQGLRIPVLAEGVETARQLDILRSEGCHEAQGYLLGRPMPMEDQPLAEVA